MPRWLRTMLDLGALEAGDASFELARPLPAWAWALIGVGAVIAGVWAYRGLFGPRVWRMTLAGLRAAAVLLVVFLLSGPELVQRDEREERDWVMVLIDRSASLTVEDGVGGGDRDAQLRTALIDASAGLTSLASERTVVPLGFDRGVFEASIDADELGPPDGSGTNLGAALGSALDRAAARPLAAVVVLSDGRSGDEVSRSAVRRLESAGAPVLALALGSAEASADVSVRRVSAPGAVFAGDLVPVEVELGSVGEAGPVTVRLVDTLTGRTLASERFADAREAGASVLLVARVEDAGEQEWAVRVERELGEDLIPANDERTLAVRVVEEPVRVLYVDGSPRWEQRYLRNLLLRERSIESSGLIIARDRRFAQEGDIELGALPASPEEWAEFDVVVLGDVDPGVFSTFQLEQLREHIATRGAGLLWIGGPVFTPGAWQDTALGDVLPIIGAAEASAEPVVMSRAVAAERLGVLRLSDDPRSPWPDQLADERAGWSRLYFAQRVNAGALKPAAEPLLMAQGAATGDRWPIGVSMRYGAGLIAYIGTDEVWRYRYGRGEVLYERFYVPLIRRLARATLERSGRRAVLTVSPDDAVVDQPVRVEARLFDQSLIDRGLESIDVRLEREPGPGEEPLERTVTLRREGDDGGLFGGVWIAEDPGRWRAAVSDVVLSASGGPGGLSAGLEVRAPDDELRNPQADHQSLERLAEETGGRMIEAADLGRLSELIPNRSRVLVSERRDALWDTPLALLIVLFVLTAEWVGRRVIRLI